MTTTTTDETKKITNNIDNVNSKIKEIENSYQKNIDTINQKKEASLLEIETTKKLEEELSGLIDKNGKVKDGYEERVATILGDLNSALGTEYKLTDNQISINGELIGSYAELQGSIDQYIKKQEQKIKAEAYEDIYKETLKEQISLEKELNNANNNVYEAMVNVTEAKKKSANATGFLAKEQANWNEKVAEGDLKKAFNQQAELQQKLNTTKNKLKECKEGFTDAYTGMANTSEIEGQKILNNTESSLNQTNNSIAIFGLKMNDSFKNMAQNNVNNYSNGLSGLSTETEQKIDDINNVIEDGEPKVQATTQWFASKLNSSLAGNIDTTEAGKQVVNGVAEGINQNKNNWNLWSALRGLKNTIVNGIKGLLGIHSPSRVMRDLVGKFIPLGISEGIDKESDSVYSSIEKLNNGIKVRTNDISIDTNQFIDYGQITGSISTQSNLSINDSIINKMGQACYSAFVTAMGQKGIKVEVEAKADKEGIFKVVKKGAEEYAMQTGESPFPVM